MLGKKGVSPFIAFILVVVISIAGVIIVMRIGSPLLEKTEEYSNSENAKNTMMEINSAIKEVSFEGNGSSRSLSIRNKKGVYRVSSSRDELTYTLNTKDYLFSDDLSRKEGDIYMEFNNRTLVYRINHTEVDMVSDERWSSGSYQIVVKNEGYSGGKTRVSISVL